MVVVYSRRAAGPGTPSNWLADGGAPQRYALTTPRTTSRVIGRTDDTSPWHDDWLEIGAPARGDREFSPSIGRAGGSKTRTLTFPDIGPHHERVFGDPSGAGTTGVDDAHAAAFFEGVGAEIMGAGMFGFHTNPDDPDWKGWWGDDPPFHTPVFVLTHTAPRAPIAMKGGTTFHFRNAPIQDVLAEATEAAGARMCG